MRTFLHVLASRAACRYPEFGIMVSEQMLGYMLAWLTEYSTEISFSGDSCSVFMSYQPSYELTQEDFSATQVDTGEVTGSKPGGFEYTCYCAALREDGSPDSPDGEFHYTRRGVMLRHAKDTVLLCYGPAATHGFDPSCDEPCQALAADGLNDIREAMNLGTSYVVYTYVDSGQMLFVFDGEDKLLAFATLGVLIY